MASERRYPIGIQTFENIVEGNYIYVDKTGIVHRLVNKYKYVFLSRPRRFGKSLIASTLKSYFEGRKELFEGLEAGKLKSEWTTHPVFHFDMSNMKMPNPEEINRILLLKLKTYEEIYGSESSEITPAEKFLGLVKRAVEQTKQKAILIIDEYDTGMLNTIGEDKSIIDNVRRAFQSFYSPIKQLDPYWEFVFITGITKYSQMSIFSQLNNLADISMRAEWDDICGITKEELLTTLKPSVEQMAEHCNLSYEEMLAKLKYQYDGYHFGKGKHDIYNPFSLIQALDAKSIENYWNSSGISDYLPKLIKKFNTNLTELDNREVAASAFDTPTDGMSTALPMLYQAGYLSVKRYNPIIDLYTLGFPNNEVRIGFIDCLLPTIIGGNAWENTGSLYGNMYLALLNDDIERALELLQSYLASIPYDLYNKEELEDKVKFEKHFQLILYLLLSSMNVHVRTEVRTATARIDFVIYGPKAIYVMELKLDGTAEEALAQIDSKHYTLPYKADHRKVLKIGINFSKETRTIEEWVIKKLEEE